MNHLEQIKSLREAIRYHRDQKGDDRCWLDDHSVWELLPDAVTEPTSLPAFGEMMKRCTAFYQYRRAEAPDSAPSDTIANRQDWDQDLAFTTPEEQAGELLRLRDAIRLHRDIRGRERTLDDDRELYAILPERLPADFRLPPEPDFLGEAMAPHAGCPSFWRSHQTCIQKTHDLHTWGPCTK
jgi:hypothetical protein